MHKVAKDKIKSFTVPDKLFYRIGEVSKITGVESYVLRYWETEFPFLRPRKNKSGQRVYVKKDLESILQIKRLLYQERYTIEGVRKKFNDDFQRAQGVKQQKDNDSKSAAQVSAEVIEHVKKRLRKILESMN